MPCADWPGDEGDTGQRKSVASGAKYVEKLNEEFSKRAPMFQDDALFIRCLSQPCPACWSYAGTVRTEANMLPRHRQCRSGIDLRRETMGDLLDATCV